MAVDGEEVKAFVDDISQSEKIRVFEFFATKVPQLAKYLEQCNGIKEGICHGDAFLWGLYKFKNRDNPNQSIDEYRVLSKKIVALNEEDIKSMFEKQELKKIEELKAVFLKILFLFQPNLILDDFCQSDNTKVANLFESSDYEALLLRDKENTSTHLMNIKESYRDDFIVSGYLNSEAIKMLFDKIWNEAAGKIIIISSGGFFFHTVSLYYKDKKIHYYDPESKTGAVECINVDDLVKKILSSLKLESNEGILSVKIIAHSSQEKGKYLDVNDFLREQNQRHALSDKLKAMVARLCIQAHDMVSFRSYANSPSVVNVFFNDETKTLLDYASDYNNIDAARYLISQGMVLPEDSKIKTFSAEIQSLIDESSSHTLDLKTLKDNFFELNQKWVSVYSSDYIQKVYETIYALPDKEKLDFLNSNEFKRSLVTIIFEPEFISRDNRLEYFLHCVSTLAFNEKENFLCGLVKLPIFKRKVLTLVSDQAFQKIIQLLDLSTEIKKTFLNQLIQDTETGILKWENYNFFQEFKKCTLTLERPALEELSDQNNFVNLTFKWSEKSSSQEALQDGTARKPDFLGV